MHIPVEGPRRTETSHFLMNFLINSTITEKFSFYFLEVFLSMPRQTLIYVHANYIFRACLSITLHLVGLQ